METTGDVCERDWKPNGSRGLIRPARSATAYDGSTRERMLFA